MSDVPVGIARLLSRAMQPALGVSRMTAFTAPAPLVEAPADAEPSGVATSRARPTPPARVASTSSRAAVEAPADDVAPTQREPETRPIPVAPAADARITASIDLDAPAPHDDVAGTLPVPEDSERRSVVAGRSSGNDAAAVRRAIDVAEPSSRSAGTQRVAQPAAALDPPGGRVAVEPAASGTSQARSATESVTSAASPPPPVVIGQIAVHVTNPDPPADPFAGCRALADGLTAKRGGGW